MKKCLQVIVIALAFAFASLPAWALGLGQMQVKSRLNEPFLAHIPIISSDPAELQELSAKLADPETFIRVGLPLPDRLVSDLQFAIETGDDGQPFIKVTSQTPVALNSLDFLVEVQWSGGRLVREYTALMAAPNTLPGAPPVVEAPVVTDNAVVTRPLPGVGVDPTVPTPDTGAELPTRTASAPSPVDSANATSLQTPTSVLASGRTYGPIRPGQTLGEVARALTGPGGDPLATMQQLLALNSEAFIGSNVNRLKAGAILRTPEGSRDVQPPDAALRTAVAAATPAIANRPTRAADSATVANEPASRAGNRVSAAVLPKPSGEARLKILAPTGQNDTPTPRSGSGSEGDGDMLQQQLQQANESLATKDAEISELKSRVAELEQLKAKQAQLISLKDSQLASAQKNLATRPATSGETSAFPWTGVSLGLLGALVLAGLAWFLLRGRADRPRGRLPSRPPSWQPGPATEPTPAVVADEGDEKPSEGTPAWARDAASSRTVATGAPVPPAPATGADTPASDFDALSKIAKARASLVIGDKAGARDLLDDVLRQPLGDDTRQVAEQLLASIR